MCTAAVLAVGRNDGKVCVWDLTKAFEEWSPPWDRDEQDGEGEEDGDDETEGREAWTSTGRLYFHGRPMGQLSCPNATLGSSIQRMRATRSHGQPRTINAKDDPRSAKQTTNDVRFTRSCQHLVCFRSSTNMAQRVLALR